MAKPKGGPKNLSLDSQAGAHRTIVKTEESAEFHCFRCNAIKKSKTQVSWATTEGGKTLCNGCHGLLCTLQN